MEIQINAADYEKTRAIIWVKSANIFKVCNKVFIFSTVNGGWIVARDYADFMTGDISEIPVLTSAQLADMRAVFVPLGTMQRKRTADK